MIQPMQHLWAPWRMAFIKGEKPAGCFFCEAAGADPGDDAAHLVLARTGLSLAILNRYPYNNGHLMVAPVAHLANLEDLPRETASDMATLTQHSLRVLRDVLKPQGFNLGINAGKTAGAGVSRRAEGSRTGGADRGRRAQKRRAVRFPRRRSRNGPRPESRSSSPRENNASALIPRRYESARELSGPESRCRTRSRPSCAARAVCRAASSNRPDSPSGIRKALLQ